MATRSEVLPENIKPILDDLACEECPFPMSDPASVEKFNAWRHGIADRLAAELGTTDGGEVPFPFSLPEEMAGLTPVAILEGPQIEGAKKLGIAAVRFLPRAGEYLDAGRKKYEVRDVIHRIADDHEPIILVRRVGQR
jgi:hypothetical protein